MNKTKLLIRHNTGNMRTITKRILKNRSTIIKAIVTDKTFFTVITFGRINVVTLINSIVTQHLYDLYIKIKRIIFIRFKNIVIKIIGHFLGYNFISSIV